MNSPQAGCFIRPADPRVIGVKMTHCEPHRATWFSREISMLARRSSANASLPVRTGEGDGGKDAVTEGPVAFHDVESCVEATIQRVGRRIRLGAPLGLGKANHLINEFFRRARENPV